MVLVIPIHLGFIHKLHILTSFISERPASPNAETACHVNMWLS
jgi:hypothetical protein